MSEAAGIAGVLRGHRFMARNAAGRMGCRGCTWTSDLTPGTDRAWAEYAEHIAAAVLDHLRTVAAGEGFIERMAAEWAGGAWEHRTPMRRRSDVTSARNWAAAFLAALGGDGGGMGPQEGEAS